MLMTPIDTSTEATILEAARKIFQQKGMEGTRMQEIADEANINKAMLYYYFRSKKKLFLAVFEDSFLEVIPDMSIIFAMDNSIEEKLTIFIDSFITVLLQIPDLPMFILSEARRDPQILVNVLDMAGVYPISITGVLQDEIDKGNIIDQPPAHIMVNIVSLCLFPFLAKPLLDAVFLKSNEYDPDLFFAERKEVIKEFVLQSIIPNYKKS